MEVNLHSFIPPGNPPKATKKNTKKTAQKTATKKKAFNYDEDFDVDDDDYEDNEDFEQELIRKNKEKQIKIPRDTYNNSTKYDDFDEDDFYSTKKTQKTTQNKKNTQNKKKTAPKYNYYYDDDDDEDENEDEDDLDEIYVNTKKKSASVAKKRPQTSLAKNKKNQTTKKSTSAAKKTTKKKPVYYDDEDEDYEEPIQTKKRPTTSTKPKNTTANKYNQNKNINKKNYNPYNANKKIVSKKPAKKMVEEEEEEEEEKEKESEGGYLSKIKHKLKDNPAANSKLFNLINIDHSKETDNFGKDKNDGHNIGDIITAYTGKKIEIKNQEEAQKAKSKLKDLFATKKKDDDDDDDNEDLIENPNKNDMNALIEKINECNYTGYNYKIKNDDYFEINGKRWETILNSEDAAIKKCEELSARLGNSKFIDPEFGSQPNDGGKLNNYSLYGKEGPSSREPNPALIEWYSIDRISDEAKFFDDGVESNDVVQGGLGDCWFVSALSVIATKDYLLRGEFSKHILDDGIIDEEETVMLSTGVYPPIFHTFRNKGIFCFKFYKNFKWRYVIIDDRLPCQKVYNINQTPTLIYGKCRAPNEFWVPLIEKAYAKMHGSYKSLISGFIDDGLVDLTGLTAKKLFITKDMLSDSKKIDELWKFLKETNSIGFDDEKEQKTQSGKTVTAKIFTRNKSMMGCGVEPKGKAVETEVVIDNHHTGILAGHAYSILDVFEIPKPKGRKRKISRLLRIRNPWGRKEWNGKWSDDSNETQKNGERIEEILNKKYEGTSEKIVLSQEDGTFLMCFSDFRKIFNKLYICVNYKPSFIGIRIHSKWTQIDSGGLPINNTPQEFADFPKNPQYYFTMAKEGKMYINLIQNDGRLTGARYPFSSSVKKAILILFSTKNGKRVENLNSKITMTEIIQNRIINLEINLQKGEYIVMPATMSKGEYADYCLEFFFEDKLKGKSKKGENFNFDRLQNVKIKKLGGENVGKIELVDISLASEISETSENKKQMMYSIFQNCLSNDDNVNYGDTKGGAGAGGVADDDDDDDEDEDYNF